jgi:hypothetical protein
MLTNIIDKIFINGLSVGQGTNENMLVIDKTSNEVKKVEIPSITPLSQGQKQYDFTIAGGLWANNSSIILGQTVAGSSGITAPGVLNANIRSLGFIGVGSTEAGGTFTENGNPNSLGLFKTNNIEYRNMIIVFRLNINNGSDQYFNCVLEKYNGTAWELVESDSGLRSSDGVLQSKLSLFTFTSGATDTFNINTFRIRLINSSGVVLTLPAQVAPLRFYGID